MKALIIEIRHEYYEELVIFNILQVDGINILFHKKQSINLRFGDFLKGNFLCVNDEYSMEVPKQT